MHPRRLPNVEVLLINVTKVHLGMKHECSTNKGTTEDLRSTRLSVETDHESHLGRQTE